MVKTGSKISSIHKNIEKSLGDFSKYFIHGTGHGVGIEVHEAPSIHAFAKGKFLNGMVFSIEPGIYFENEFGLRIEDLCTVNNGETEIITNFPKDINDLIL